MPKKTPLANPRKPQKLVKTSVKPKTAARKPRRRVAKPVEKNSLSHLAIEGLALCIAMLLATMLIIGYISKQFSGADLLLNLLPFAMTLGIWTMTLGMLMMFWLRWRHYLLRISRGLPLILSLGMLATLLSFGAQTEQRQMLEHLRTLLGGRQQAARINLEHQVYAAYRRYDQTDLQEIIARATAYNADIADAAATNNLDLDIMLGLAAAESSFLPRDSKDGGHGLFQITAIPDFLLAKAQHQLGATQLSINDNRHNAFIAAVTLKHYLQQMQNDLFLGLLAYNIGPRNGGLQFIMQQYGANDFVSMQPYLQQLPRDYPVRVLAQALAFRIWRHEGHLLAYQDEGNAARIQALGIPGMLPIL